jgi:hypothetical protein
LRPAAANPLPAFRTSHEPIDHTLEALDEAACSSYSTTPVVILLDLLHSFEFNPSSMTKCMEFLFKGFSKRPGIIRKGLLGIILAASWTASAQPLFLVTSTTDGNGLFSYTFNLASSSDIWGVSTNGGGAGILIQSHGILNVIRFHRTH